jgi:hypothetical protein
MRFNSVLLSGFLALCSITYATAQSDNVSSKVTVGVRGGVTLPNLTGGNSDDPVSTGYSTATRFGAAVFAEIKFSNLFSLRPMLEYSQEGAKRNGMQALVATGSDPNLSQLFGGLQQLYANFGPMLPMLGMSAPDQNVLGPAFLYANAQRTAKMDYLMLPVLAKFGWDLGKSSPWRVYVDAGPYVALLLNAKNVVSINNNGALYADKAGSLLITDKSGTPLIPTIPDALQSMIPADIQSSLTQLSTGLTQLPDGLSGTQNIKDQLHTFNWGLEANIGIQYQFNRNRVFLEVGGNYGLMNIQKSTGNGQYLNGKNNIGAATLMIGYAYSL